QLPQDMLPAAPCASRPAAPTSIRAPPASLRAPAEFQRPAAAAALAAFLAHAARQTPRSARSARSARAGSPQPGKGFEVREASEKEYEDEKAAEEAERIQELASHPEGPSGTALARLHVWARSQRTYKVNPGVAVQGSRLVASLPMEE
ncbi:unnamed protein product, partial [Effrenium voratum]